MRALAIIATAVLVAAPAHAAPDAHFLDDGDWFIAAGPLEYARLDVELGKQLKASGDDGVARFKMHRTGYKTESKHFWQARVPVAGDLAPGKLVVVYTGDAPRSRDEAVRAGWELRRVAFLDDPGKVTLFGLDTVDLARVRAVVNDPSPAIAITSKRDAHLFHDEVWLVWGEKEAPPAGEPVELRAALATGGKNEYRLLHDGSLVTSTIALRTRAAKKSGVKLGDRVAINTELQEGDTLDASHAGRALGARWVVGPIIQHDRWDTTNVKHLSGKRTYRVVRP